MRDPQPTSSTKSSYTWHVTHKTQHVKCYMWLVTRDMWYLTCDTWCGVNILSKLQLPGSNGLGVMKFWRLGGKGWLTYWIDDEGDCRTAPATPGPWINTNIPSLQNKIYQSLPIALSAVSAIKREHVRVNYNTCWVEGMAAITLYLFTWNSGDRCLAWHKYINFPLTTIESKYKYCVWVFINSCMCLDQGTH